MNRHGFTLMELAVVLAIMGMLLLLAIPRLPSSEGERLKSSARTLAATLRYMQERASAGRALYLLYLEPGSDVVRVRQVVADGSEREPDDVLLRKRPIREGILVADVLTARLGKQADGQVRLVAGGEGLKDFAAIHLRSPGGGFWTVMAFPGGKVELFPGYREEAP